MSTKCQVYTICGPGYCPLTPTCQEKNSCDTAEIFFGPIALVFVSVVVAKLLIN